MEFGSEHEKLNSEKLKKMTKFEENGGLIPSFLSLIHNLEEMITFKKDEKGKSQLPFPTPGYDDSYDEAQEKVITFLIFGAIILRFTKYNKCFKSF